MTAAITGARIRGRITAATVSTMPATGAVFITTLAIPCSTWDGRMLHSRNATTASPRTLSLKLRVSSHDRPNASNERSEEHTSELQSLAYLVCRLLLEKKKKIKI